MTLPLWVGETWFQSDNLGDIAWSAQSGLGRRLDAGFGFRSLPEDLQHFYALNRYCGNIGSNGHNTTFRNWHGAVTNWLVRAETAASYFGLSPLRAVIEDARSWAEKHPDFGFLYVDETSFRSELDAFDKSFFAALQSPDLEAAVDTFLGGKSDELQASVRELWSKSPPPTGPLDAWKHAFVLDHPALTVVPDSEFSKPVSDATPSDGEMMCRDFERFRHHLPDWREYLLLDLVGDTGPMLSADWTGFHGRCFPPDFDLHVQFVDDLAMLRVEGNRLRLWHRTGHKEPMELNPPLPLMRKLQLMLSADGRRDVRRHNGFRTLAMVHNARSNVARRGALIGETTLDFAPRSQRLATRLHLNEALHLLLYDREETAPLTGYRIDHVNETTAEMQWSLRSFANHYKLQIDRSGAQLGTGNGRSLDHVTSDQIASHAALLRDSLDIALPDWNTEKGDILRRL